MPHYLPSGPRLRALVFTLLFCAIGGTFQSLALAQPPAIPLANHYHPDVDLAGYWLSEKLDGVRAYWDGERLMSRGGHPYQVPEGFSDGFPDQPLDGELWSGRQRFAQLSGAVRKAHPVAEEWREIRFHVFDLPLEDLPFYRRYRQLQALVKAAETDNLVLVEQQPVASHRALMAELQAVEANGGEGLMLKRKDSLYRAGRSDDLLKVKSHQDAEAVVIGHTRGKGKYRGSLGALVVRLDDGRKMRIGTGFSDRERASPPPVGSGITFRYRGLTATGLPRFASFLRVRNDEPGH